MLASYIVGQSNPADQSIRGVFAANLLANSAWLLGPNCIDTLINEYKFESVDVSELPKLRKIKLNFLSILEPSILDFFSSYEKLINVVAYIWGFSTTVVT